MYFYIQKDNDALYELLTIALKNAVNTGIIDELMFEFYGDSRKISLISTSEHTFSFQCHKSKNNKNYYSFMAKRLLVA